MRLVVVGCAGSFPGPASPASCYLIQQQDDSGRVWSIVLDLGNGALGPLQTHLDPRLLDGIFLSHLHPDHCLDICGLYVMHKYHPDGSCGHRTPVFGARDSANRLTMAYTGIEDGSGMATIFDFVGVRDREPIRLGPFTVTPVRVNHPVECYGLRVEAGGTVLAYTGDTDACPALTPLMTGADLVLADSAFVEGRDPQRGVHLTARRAAQAAVDAGGVRRLMLTHMPAWNDPVAARQEAGAVWAGGAEAVEAARAGDVYEL